MVKRLDVSFPRVRLMLVNVGSAVEDPELLMVKLKYAVSEKSNLTSLTLRVAPGNRSVVYDVSYPSAVLTVIVTFVPPNFSQF
jgi:hypothetical protein